MSFCRREQRVQGFNPVQQLIVGIDPSMSHTIGQGVDVRAEDGRVPSNRQISNSEAASGNIKNVKIATLRRDG